MVAVTRCAGTHADGVRAGIRLGQGERSDPLRRRRAWKAEPFLLFRASLKNCVSRDAIVRSEQGLECRSCVAELEDELHFFVGVQAEAVVLLRDREPIQAHGLGLSDDLFGELVRLIDLCFERDDFFTHKVPDPGENFLKLGLFHSLSLNAHNGPVQAAASNGLISTSSLRSESRNRLRMTHTLGDSHRNRLGRHHQEVTSKTAAVVVKAMRSPSRSAMVPTMTAVAGRVPTYPIIQRAMTLPRNASGTRS
jgi:hypothetical protein